jgi:predicted nucleic acid-binding protein
MIFVDTGYLWALIDKADELPATAAAWQTAVSDSLITTEYVLWEMLNGFSMPEDRRLAHAVLEDVLASPADWTLIRSSVELFELGIRLHKQHADKSWSLTDCISFIIMRERGITRALTHDHHFEQAGFEALLRRDSP